MAIRVMTPYLKIIMMTVIIKLLLLFTIVIDWHGEIRNNTEICKRIEILCYRTKE